MAVRASPISKTAAILIVVVGLFVLLTGLVAGVVTTEVEGTVFVVLGVALYGLLRRFTRELRKETQGSPASSQTTGR